MSWTCWDRIYGLPQSGRRGFGKFYHMRHGKIMSGFNKREVPKFLGFSFKGKQIPKISTFEKRANRRKVFNNQYQG